jgi:hypothetical protein
MPLLRRGFGGLVLVCIALATQAGARADVTIRNYDGGGTAQANSVNIFDTQRNKIDVTDGALIQLPDGSFALYGSAWSCGWRLGQQSAGSNPHGMPWCGVNVYTSPDLRNHNWTYRGPLFDVNATNVDDAAHTISAGCAGATHGASSEYCGIPKVRLNPNTGLYNVWVALRSGGASGNYVNVFTCTSPTGGCTQHPQITFAVAGATVNDLEPLIDGTNIYLFHTDQNVNAYVEKLAADGLSVSSTLQTFPSIGEGISAFKSGSTYYYLSGSGCNYCNDAITQYWISTTNIASWPTSGQAGANILSHSTCFAQNFNVTQLTAGGITTYLLKATRYFGPPAGGPGAYNDHGKANEFWYPLSFTGTTINPMVGCSGDPVSSTIPATVTVPGVTPVTPPVFTADVTSEGGLFGSHCDITAAGTAFPQLSRMQVFTPTQSGTRQLEFMAAECNQNCPFSSVSGVVGCPGPDSNLLVQVFNTTGSGTAAVPTGPALFTYTGNPQSNVTWAQGSPNPVPWVPHATQMTVSLTAGVAYALVMSAAPGATVGSYTSTYDQTGTNPYPAGFEATSVNWPTGNTWTVEANVAAKFSIINTGLVAGPPTGGFRRFGHH